MTIDFWVGIGAGIALGVIFWLGIGADWLKDWRSELKRRRIAKESRTQADFENALNSAFEAAERQLAEAKRSTGKCLEDTGIGTSLGSLLCQLPVGHDGPHWAERGPR